MKHIVKQDVHHLVRLEREEEFHEALKAFAQEHNIGAASFTAIGASETVDLSYYHLDGKRYDTKTFDEELEIIGITGNISTYNGEIIVHAHGSFGRNVFSNLSGHVSKLIVSATCEVMMMVYDGKIERAMDESIGLPLMDRCHN